MFERTIGENLEVLESDRAIFGETGFYLRDIVEWEKIFIHTKDIPELIEFLKLFVDKK